MSDADLPQHAPKLTYGTYLKVPELLGLQHIRSEPAHHDELLFILSHQVYELWFKQILHEVGQINRYLDGDHPLQAVQLLGRVQKIQHLLIEQIPVLETMFATNFVQFRDSLGTASGFQSVQFRKLEFLCGAKNAKMLNLVGEESQRAELEEALKAPTMYDHFLHHMKRVGFDIPAEILERDTSKPHEPNEATVRELSRLYECWQQCYPQFILAEALLEFEERTSIWRFHHVKMVERMIGAGIGTGGSSGAKYLRSTVDIRFFPDIWMVRDNLAKGSTGYGAGCPMGGGR